MGTMTAIAGSRAVLQASLGLWLAICASLSSVAQSGANVHGKPAGPGERGLLTRRYEMGEKLAYHMNGTNRDRASTTNYEVDARGVVRKNTAGEFYEEYSWSNLIVNDKPVALPDAARNFAQTVSLDPGFSPSVPDLSQVIPLIGPITDLLTFYSDLWLANRIGKLNRAGDHLYFARGAPNSWADGTYTVVGEDSVDFDLTLKEIDAASHTATLVVRHVPPAKPQVKLPAAWMGAPVAETRNNWVQIQKSGESKYSAEVGKETFDVELKVSLEDGKILSATLDNPVEILARECVDMTLSRCGDPVRYQVRRHVELGLVP